MYCPNRGVLSMQWKVPERNGFILFASTKRTKSSPEGCDPLDSGDGSKLYRIVFSWHFQHSSLNWYVVRPAFKEVLNRCERVAVHQTQDWYCSKMGYCTASSQGRMYSKRVAARYLGCGGNLFLQYADWKFWTQSRFCIYQKIVLSEKAIHFHNLIVSL